jgi:hypothetical protein
VKKIHNLVAIALSMAFFISCGKQEKQEDGKPNIRLNQALEVSDIPEIESSEKSLIQSACALLADKERAVKRKMGSSLNFDTSTRQCGVTKIDSFKTSAKIIFRNGVPALQNNNNNTFMFDDLILRTDSIMKTFCNSVESDSLTTRYNSLGSSVEIIMAEAGNDAIIIQVATAFDYNKNGSFDVELIDSFEIIDNGTSGNGFLLRRVSESTTSCSGDGVLSYGAKLIL